MHRLEQVADEVEIAVFIAGDSEFLPHADKPVLLIARRKRGDRLAREFDRPLGVGVHDRKQGLGEPGEIPLRDGRLIGVGVAPKFIDRAKAVAGSYKSMKAQGPKSIVFLKAQYCRCSSRHG